MVVIPGGEIKKSKLIKLIEDNFSEDVPITIMCENGVTGVGYNASTMDCEPPEMCEDTGKPWSKIYFTF